MDENTPIREGTEPEKAALRRSMDAVIAAAEKGVRPDPVQQRRLLALWSVKQPQSSAVRDDVAAVMSADDVENISDSAIRQATTALIQACLDRPDFVIQGRQIFHMMPAIEQGRYADLFARAPREKIGRYILDSLEQSLDHHDDLTVIARKVTMLHDFPEEVGGGGFSGMNEVPLTIRQKLYARLLEALDHMTGDAMTDTAFGYIFSRAIIMDLRYVNRRVAGIDENITGNALLRAIITWKQGWAR